MTITFKGEQVVAINDLIVSDEFALRVDRPNVREMADSIAELGCIHPPLARREPDGSYLLGPGEDRVAAHVLLGRTSVLVRIIACEDHELELLREAENRVRRKESSSELLEMVERLTAERDKANEALVVMAEREAGALSDADALRDDLAEATSGALTNELVERVAADFPRPDEDGLTDEDPEPGRKGGRPKSNRMRAVERVAAATGRKPETVRKAVEREARRREKASIETWGREQAPEWLEPVLELRATISGVYDRMKAAAGTLTKTKLDMAHEREELRNMARAIRARRPAAVCAWCKNADQYVTDCTACKGLGWISEEMLEQVPESLRDPRKAMVQGDEVALEYTLVCEGVWCPPESVLPGLTGSVLANVVRDNHPLNPAFDDVDQQLLDAADVVIPEVGGEVVAVALYKPLPPDAPEEDERSEDAQCKGCGLTADLCECGRNYHGHVGIDPDAEYDDGPSLEDML